MHALVAQMAEALDSGSRGWRFESARGTQHSGSLLEITRGSPCGRRGRPGRAGVTEGYGAGVTGSTRVIEGSRLLPQGFAHPHASPQAKRIAEQGLILRTQVGSGTHGTAVSGQDDRDEMGICLEPPQYVTGVARSPTGVNGTGPSMVFEQYERHTAWDRPGGIANRSGAQDLDVVVYSARKWARLALAGNPTVLLVLFVPDADVVHRDVIGGANWSTTPTVSYPGWPRTGSWATCMPRRPR